MRELICSIKLCKLLTVNKKENMKTIRTRFLIIILLLSLITYGYVNKAKNNYFLYKIQEPIEQRILGVWEMENSPTNRIEFLTNGQLKYYEDNVLLYTDTYSISNICEGFQSNDNRLYLKQIDSEDGTIFCFLINGVNENNSEILSLTTSNQGKLLIYKRP